MRRFAVLASLLALASACDRTPPPRLGAAGTLVFVPDAVYGWGSARSTERANAFFASQIDVLRSQALLERVQSRLMLSDAEVEALRDAIAASRKGDSLAMEIFVAGKDPARAATLCRAVMESLIGIRLERESALDNSRAAYLDDLLRQAQQRDAGTEAEAIRKIRTSLAANAGARVSDVTVLEACRPTG